MTGKTLAKIVLGTGLTIGTLGFGASMHSVITQPTVQDDMRALLDAKSRYDLPTQRHGMQTGVYIMLTMAGIATAGAGYGMLEEADE